MAIVPARVAAQGASIGIYDASTSTCTLADQSPHLLRAYVVVSSQSGAEGVRFAAPKPDCFAATWVGDEVPPGLVAFGDSQTGISVAFGVCGVGTQHVLTIDYQTTGTTGACCDFPIVPDPFVGDVQYADCSFAVHSATPLKAVINADPSCPCSDLPDFPPTTPDTPSPSDGAVNQSANVDLYWVSSDPEGQPLHFDVYLGDTPDPPQVADDIPTMSFDPDTLAYATTYYWKVVALDPASHASEGPVWTFTTRPPPPPPPLPSDPSPGDGSIDQPRKMNLMWGVYPGLVEPLTFDVYFGTDSNPPFVTEVPGATFPVSYLALDTVYYWRIVARGLEGGTTSGPIWSFRTTSVNVPPNGPFSPSPPDHYIHPIAVRLQWQGGVDPDGGPVRFDVYFGTDVDPPLFAADLTDRSQNLGVLTPETDYYWRVVVKDADGGSTSGPVWTFRAGTNLPPVVPFSPSPPDGAVNVSLNVTLAWQSSDPEGGTVTFDVYFGSSPGPAYLVSTTNKQVQLSPLQGGVHYYWRVVARDPDGRISAGPVWSFTTQGGNNPPVAPFNPSPADNAVNVGAQPLLSWQSSDPEGGSLTYDVYFGTTTTPPKVATRSVPNYSPGTLQGETVYYWKILARDAQGLTTMGPLWTFTTRVLTPPLTPFNPSPPDSAVNVLRQPLLVWQSGDPDGGSMSYDVYFGTTTTPPKVATRGAPDYQPGTLQSGVTFHWQILARDSQGQTTLGPLWTFTTQPLVTPFNPNPADNAVDVSRRPTLTWQSSGAVSYDVYFGSLANHPLVATKSNPTFQPGTLEIGTSYYWLVVARGPANDTATGPLWSFVTSASNLPPAPPSNPTPPDGQTDLPGEVTLQWESSDPEGLGVRFDVYFGAGTPQLIASDQAVSSYPVSALQPLTHYNWRVVARDYDGNEVSGPTWSFVTMGTFPPPASVGLYADEAGSVCTLDDAPGLRTVYVVVDGPDAYTGVRFAAPRPSCFDATWVADSSPYVTVGSSQTGVSLAFGPCLPMPVTVMSITYLSAGNTPGCCTFPLVPDPWVDNLLVAACNFAVRSAVNYPVLNISSDGSCGFCARSGFLAMVAAEDTCLLSAHALTVDIRLDPGPPGATGGSMDVEFDASTLTFLACERGPLAQTWDTFTYTEDGGVISIAGVADAGYDSSSVGVFARLTFESQCCTWGAPLTLRLRRAGGDFSSLRLIDGRLTCRFVPDGDVNNDGALTVADAQCALETYLYSPLAPPGDCAGPAYAVRSNVDCSLITTPGDAYCIFLQWLDQSCVFCAGGGGAHATSTSAPAPRISLRTITEGDEVVIEVRADGPDAVRAVGFELRYPPELSFVRVEPAGGDGLATLQSRVREPGRVRIGAYAGSGAAAVHDGALLAVRLRALSTPRGTVTAGAFVDDLAGAADASAALDGDHALPSLDRVVLYQNTPNPFNPTTSIRFDLPDARHVRLSIFDVGGKRVATLVDGRRASGTVTVEWDGTDDAGRTVATGVYFYVLDAGGERFQRKMVLLK